MDMGGRGAAALFILKQYLIHCYFTIITYCFHWNLYQKLIFMLTLCWLLTVFSVYLGSPKIIFCYLMQQLVQYACNFHKPASYAFHQLNGFLQIKKNRIYL